MPSKIRTVLGDVSPSVLRATVTHEHGLLYEKRSGLDQDAYLKKAMPPAMKRLEKEFRALIARGCNGFVECSLRVRTPVELREVARRTGMHLVLSTGFYTEDSLAPRVKRMSVAQLADYMLTDVTKGILGTGVRAGVVKTSSNGYELGPTERKIFEAAAIVHKKTGVPITTHTTKGARRQTEFFKARGVALDKVAYGHIEVDPWEDTLWAAKQGAMFNFTNFGGEMWVPEDMVVAEIRDLVRRGHVKQVMISVDMYLYWLKGRIHLRWPGGFVQIFDRVIPKLRKAGLSRRDIEIITEENPRRHLAF